MKLREIFEDGRIVKGVNTTVDVGPNEITKQAKKFGNTVDKDGRPPTLSKKIKGKSTNVLFNLGLAEKMLKEATELSSASTIYVDMDGVLADFFGAWAKLMDKDHWTKIDDIMPALQKIRDTENFFLDLPLTANAKNLLSLIKDVKGEYVILSSPLPDDPNSEPHKREWIKKNLNFFPPKDVIITHDKARYAKMQDGTPNILIDDYGKNIQSWEAAGGIGFKHKDHKFERTAKNIKQHMKEPVEERELTKSEIKKRDKTADKIMDKPKAKKGIAKWAKDKGMDPEGAVYAIATNMAKKESYTRDQLPQLRQKNLKNIKHTMEWVHIKNLIPVQKERIIEKFKRQVDRILEGKYNPIVVDRHNKIVNGHHRYEAAKLMGYDEMAVAKLPFTIKQIVENFADGKKKESITEKTQSPAQWQKAMIKKYGEDGWYDIADAVRDYYESNAILDNTISDIIKIKNDHPSFTDYSGITKLYRYEKKDKNSAPTDDTFIPFAYNIKGAKNFVQSMAQGNMGFKKSDFELVEKDFNPGDAILNFTNLIELVHNAEDDDGEWYKREYEVWMKRTPYYAGTETNENFADGKKKGKSRPGRVKRSGASCKGSVTSLRKKAKNASGERAKMYHWCANMKSGRNK